MNTGDGWSRHSTVYEQNFAEITTQWAVSSLKLVPLPAEASFLDVACGPGNLSCLAAQAGCKVVATDFAHAMVERAKANLGKYAKAEARCIDGQTLEGIADGSMDAVGSNFGIFLFPDRSSGWRSAFRVLKSGGTLFATSWSQTSESVQIMKPLLQRLPQTMVLGPANNTCSLDTFIKEVESCGFVEVKGYEIMHPFIFKTMQDFVQFTFDNPCIGAVLQTAPKEVLQKDLAESYLKKQITGPVDQIADWMSPVVFNGTGLLVVARKP